MKTFKVFMIIGVAMAITLTAGTLSYATETDQYGGHKASWATSWTAMSGLNDPDDGVESKLDFVGDATNPGAYVAWDSSYLYFRIRTDVGTADTSTWQDAILIVLDSSDAGVVPNWGIAWDTKGVKTAGQELEHGLEMMVPGTTGSTWAGTKLQDLDGNPALKIAPPDYLYTGGNGYVRTVDNQSTTNFGTTTYIDFALSWSYLDTATSGQIVPGTSWNIQLGSIRENTDHAFLAEDIAGGLSPSSSVAYSAYQKLGDDPVTVPEPTTCAALIILGALKFALRKRR